MNNGQQTGAKVIAESEKLRLTHNIKLYSKYGYLALGVSGFCLGMAFIQKYYVADQAQQTIDFRKQRLSQPVLELSGSSGTQIPWSTKSVDEYLFRKVRITGRPLHNRTMFIPATQYGLEGAYAVVPLCTKETESGDPIEGVLLNRGFVPKYNINVAQRNKIEDSFHQQTFDCYVSKMEESTEHGLLTPGNTPDVLERNKWNYVNLKEMSKMANFQNKEAVSACVLERVNFDTPLNERDQKLADIDSDYRQDYPYSRTLSGALQTNKMPWDARNSAGNYFTAGLASAVLGLTLLA